MAAGLKLGLQFEGQYPDPIADEFRQLIAALQQWAGGTGFSNVPNDIQAGGKLTVQQQPGFRVFINPATVIPSGVEQPISWLYPGSDPTSLPVWDTTGVMFENVNGEGKAWLTDPGVYLIQARIRWDANAAGNFRILQMRIYGDDQEGDVDAQAPVASMTQHVGCVVRVTQELLDRASFPRGIPVQIEASQDSGGNRSLSSLSWWSIVKLF